jgi:hypothetical protein
LTAGIGYTVALSATDSHGDPCSGTSAPFNIVAGATTSVGVLLSCVVSSDAAIPADVTTGSLAIDAGVVLIEQPPITCPGISSFSISPSEILPGQIANLAISTVGPAPMIGWTSSPTVGALIGDPAAPSTTFRCSEPGDYLIRASVGLPDSGVCAGVAFTTVSAIIVCEGIPADAGGG